MENLTQKTTEGEREAAAGIEEAANQVAGLVSPMLPTSPGNQEILLTEKDTSPQAEDNNATTAGDGRKRENEDNPPTTEEQDQVPLLIHMETSLYLSI